MPFRILVADTNRAALDGLVRVLNGAGYVAEGAATPDALHAQLAAAPPDLLVAEMRRGPSRGPHLLLGSRVAPEALLAAGHCALNPSCTDDPALRTAAAPARSLSLTELLVLIARLLGPPNPGQLRRWPRRRVTGLFASVGGSLASLIDVSYGGVRFAMAGAAADEIPHVFELQLPAYGVSMHVRQVWTHRSDIAGTAACGAELADTNPERHQIWRSLIDTML